MIVISCIIPSSGKDFVIPHLKQCLNSLLKVKIKEISLIIIVISSDSELREKLLNEKLHNFLLIDKSLGFAEMNNIAISEVLRIYDPDYILFMNDDAWVSSNFFEVFQSILQKIKFDIITPIIYKENSKYLDSFGIEYFKSGYARNSLDEDIKTTLVPAACMFVKTTLLRKLRKKYGFYFNPLLYYYLEDVEFSIRAITIGAKIYKNPKLIAYHEGSLTSNRKSFFVIYHTYRNLLWIIFITWPSKIITRNIISIIVVQIWLIIYSLINYGPWIYLRIYWSTLINLKMLLRARGNIINKYDKNFNFSDIFSKLTFRTYHGWQIN